MTFFLHPSSYRSLSLLSICALILGMLCLGAAAVQAEEPIKALFITGGGYHDYHALAPLLTAGMSKRANVTFDIKMCDNGDQLIAIMKDPDLGKGYDVVVYDMCHVDIYDDTWIENAKRVIHEGKPTVMIHCAMHCFWKGRTATTWGECCGLYTNHHEAFAPFDVAVREPRNPIVKFWPEHWRTAGDELYHNEKFPFPENDTCEALLTAKDPQGVDQVVAWTHLYGKGKVFATTLGHDMKTAETDDYLHLLANGLLWTVGKLGTDGKPKEGYAGTGVTK